MQILMQIYTHQKFSKLIIYKKQNNLIPLTCYLFIILFSLLFCVSVVSFNFRFLSSSSLYITFPRLLSLLHLRAKLPFSRSNSCRSHRQHLIN